MSVGLPFGQSTIPSEIPVAASHRFYLEGLARDPKLRVSNRRCP